jgi:hypothetical protein
MATTFLPAAKGSARTPLGPKFLLRGFRTALGLDKACGFF